MWKRSLLAAALFAICLPIADAHADNPIIQTHFTADPAPLVHEAVVYLYTSRDEDDATGFKMLEWPTGPWMHKGKIMDPNKGSTGNHPGLIDYKGNSYIFGFNYRLNFAMTPIHHERRSITVGKFSYNPDGTIPNLPWWDDKGVEQLEPINPYKRVEAETIAWTSRIKRDRDRPYDWAPGVTTAMNDGTGVYVTRTTDRSYFKVAGVDFGKGAKTFIASVANGQPHSTIELRLDRVDGPAIGSMDVGATGAPGQWREKSTNVSNAIGVRDLYMVFKGRGEQSMLDIDYWRFAR